MRQRIRDRKKGTRGLCYECLNHETTMMLCDPPIIRHTCRAKVGPTYQKEVALEGMPCTWFREKNTTVREVWE